MDELNNEDEQDQGQVVEKDDQKKSRPDNRFKDLSDKVETTAKERDEAKAEADKAKKDAEFYKGFSTTASKYQGATEYQDKIKEKVDAGYDLEDATVAVLAKEGKLNQPQTRQSPAGGSATTAMRQGGEKTVSEMTREEKREALIELERESGVVSQILRNGL